MAPSAFSASTAAGYAEFFLGTSIMRMRQPAIAAQGATSDRVLVHMHTAEKGAKAMPNSAMAYVSLSRPRNEIKLYTDDVKWLERMLENSEAKKVALQPEQIEAYGIGQVCG